MKMNNILVKVGLFLVLANGAMAMIPVNSEPSVSGIEEKQNSSTVEGTIGKALLQFKQKKEKSVIVKTQKWGNGTVFNKSKTLSRKEGTVFNNA